ncbi:MAG: pirin family protein [Chitinophagaceae bacterium]
MMKKILHLAGTRGHANHGWLNTYHTFSFAQYQDPERMNFGLLRVLNDDEVKGGSGFGSHPHDNMEIVTIPLKGSLEHRDNTGRHGIIRSGDVQIMSAGTGIVHSEFNPSTTEMVNLLQIWVFPKKRNIIPHYDQKTYDQNGRHNQLQLVVSPETSEKTLWINQDAWFSLGNFQKGQLTSYQPAKAENGLYFFLIEGQLEVEGEPLSKRDGLGISDCSGPVRIKALEDAYFLVMDVPMN